VTQIEGGAQRLVELDQVSADPLGEEIDAALRSGKSGMVEREGVSSFLTVQVPPVRLVVIGAVHISQALAPMAKMVGFDMVIVDPRTAFATPERFPDVPVLAEWPEVALPPMKIDRYTAICCFTHDPKIDDPALEQALRAQCFYIGALGSRKTHGKRLERLTAKGFGAEDMARIRAPIGLDIGAVTPPEIATSVLGEIILALRKKPLRVEKPA
jgi:xanthine dehydrogenase accessory factor